MKSVDIKEFMTDPQLQRAAGATLREEDGLVCFPCRGTYRIAANLLSEAAVFRLLQTKRRAKRKPALVLVPRKEALQALTTDLPDAAQRLMAALWPGELTLRLPLDPEPLPPKVYRELARPDRKVGFRLAVGPVAQLVVREANVPLLVSSANLSQKKGAASVAAIRKNFSRGVALFIDSGDLPDQPPSTVVEPEGDGYKAVRVGTLTEEAIARALGQA